VRRRRAGLFGLPPLVRLAAVAAAVAALVVPLIVLGAARLSEDNGETAKAVATRSVQPATSTSTSTQVAPATTVEQPVPSGPDSPGVERETHNEVDDYSPVLSPDGSSLAYVSLRNNVWNLYLLDLKARNEVQLTAGGNAYSPTFSPDGGSILFSMEDGSTHSIFRLGLEDRALSRITTGEANDYYPRERADGTIVFFSDREDATTSIFVLDPKTNEMRQMTYSGGSDYWPSWSPDGSSIVFDSDRSGNQDLYLLSVETGQTTQLTSESGRDAVGSFSPDGRWLVFESDRSSTHQIYVMDMTEPKETRDVFQITDFPLGAWVASFSRGGEALVFQAETESGFEIFRMPFPLAVRQTSPATPTVVAQATPIATAVAIATPTPPDLSSFAKDWWHHGFNMTVEMNGQSSATWRTYKWCSQDPTPPCDAVVDNGITPGGSATLTFTQVDGQTAYALVNDSNDWAVFEPGTLVSLTLLPYGMALLKQGSTETTLCGPDYSKVAPESLIQTTPCGA
jgi:dipeptidyl aminopeptidase/acylaminoacyl peptidase